jgi:hypothetical protein
VAGAVFALQVGAVSAGVIAIPASLVTIFGIWAYVTAKPCVRRWLRLRPAADDPDHDEK